MHHIARNLILAFVIAALARLDAPLRAAPPINSNRQDWITQYVEDDVVNALSQLYVVTRGDSSKFGDDPRLELRTGDLSKRISRMSASIGLGSRFNLTDEQQRNIGSLLDGAYLLAWTNGAGRCSNVLKFVIDSHHKPTDEPVLRLTQLEPARRGQMGQLVVTACWRIAAEGAPTQSQLAFATVILDGKEFNPREEISIGPYRPIRSGETWSQMVALDEYDLKTDAGQAHQIAVRVSTFQTKPQLLKADTPLAARGGTPARRRAADFARDRGGEMTSIEAKYAELRQRRARAKDASDAREFRHGLLGDAWDRATATIVDAPAQPVSLRGSIIGVGSLPIQKYEVHLRGPGAFETITAADGTFAFANIPAGQYEFFCNPPGEGSPMLLMEAIDLPRPVDKPLSLSFVDGFAISGTVATAAGEAAAGRDVDSTWRSPGGDVEYDCSARTDDAGHYQIDSPFALATYVGMSTTGNHPDPYHDVQAPRDNVNFRLVDPSKAPSQEGIA